MAAIHNIQSNYNTKIKFDDEENSSKKENQLNLIDKIEIDADNQKEERIENICTILPLAVTGLAIILMYILYKIFT